MKFSLWMTTTGTLLARVDDTHWKFVLVGVCGGIRPKPVKCCFFQPLLK